MPSAYFPKVMDEPMQVDASVENNNSQEQNDYSQDEYLVIENATLDVEAYAKNYVGFGKLSRLLFIADHCQNLRMEALWFALNYIQTTHDTNIYRQIHKQLKEMVPLKPDSSITVPDLDNEWIEVTNRRAPQTLEKLDTDLKSYKSNSIKESIRRGNDDLGDHYMDMGDLCNALKCYSRARDYCTSPKHVVNMCLNVIKISVFLENWSQVINHIQKAENALGRAEEEDPVADTKLKCLNGLADLSTGKYKSAAKNFLQASFDDFNYPELFSVNNIATYGTLCSLAAFDRQELQKNVISSIGFKMFLESEPQLRDILNTFNQSKYFSCLKLMDEIRSNLLLDIFLAPHIDNLYALIRKKALCQYFSPYLSADMHMMSDAFNTSIKDLEDELMHLILEGEINGRIDSHNKILYAQDIDQRSSTFEKSVALGQEYERRTKAMILRSALLKHQILVTVPSSKEKSPTGAVSEVAPPPSGSTKLPFTAA